MRALTFREDSLPRPIRSIGFHQLAAFAATLVDFAVMTALVELLAFTPPSATALGAFSGGATNFVLGRRYVFGDAGDGLARQASRYALVSFGSLLLNVAGEALLVSPGLHYLAARIVVSFVVSLGFNYPAQRFFVFAPRGR
jgi:putative flippase GtrA